MSESPTVPKDVQVIHALKLTVRFVERAVDAAERGLFAAAMMHASSAAEHLIRADALLTELRDVKL